MRANSKNQESLIKAKANEKKQKLMICLEIIVALLLIIIPFFSYSFSNCINMITGFGLLIIMFNFFSKRVIVIKKLSLLVLFFYNIEDIVFRFLLLTLRYLNIGQYTLAACNQIYSIDKTNIAITVVGIISSAIIITITGGYYLFFKWNEQLVNEMQFKDGFESLLSSINIDNEIILMIGLMFICLGASILPTTIGLALLFIIFGYYYSFIFKYENDSKVLQIINRVPDMLTIVIPIYQIINYFINCNPIYFLLVKSEASALYGSILYYTKQESYYHFNLFHSLTFFFYLFGFCFVNLYQMKKTNSNRNTQLKKNVFLAFLGNNPEFVFHLWRISLIVWITTNIDIFSLKLILWLLSSLIFDNCKWFYGLARYFFYPFLFVFLVISYVCNIKGTIASPNQSPSIYGLKVYETELQSFSQMILKLIAVFLIGIYIRVKHSSLYLSEDDKSQMSEMKDMNSNSHMTGNNHFDHIFADEENDNAKYVLTSLDILLKLFFVINNWLLIIFLYLGIAQCYSFLNGLLLFILIGIIIELNFFTARPIYYSIFTLFNLSFFSKYITYFIYPDKTISIKTSAQLVLSLIYYDYLLNSHYLWIAFYFLYIKYSSRLSRHYSQYYNRHLSISEIIKGRFVRCPKIKVSLCIIFALGYDLYIWILFALLIIPLIAVQSNLLSYSMLILVFIIYYKYIRRMEMNTNAVFYSKILTIFSIIAFALVYIWQTLESFIELNSPRIRKYMSLIGLQIDQNNTEIRLLPYISCLILSIALTNQLNSTVSNQRNRHHNRLLKFNLKRLLLVLNYFLHFYWFAILFVIALLSIHWMLSLSMLIEICLLLFFILKSFMEYCRGVHCYQQKGLSNNEQFNIEKQFHFKISSNLQTQYYNIALIVTVSSIVLSYGSGLLFKFISYDSPNKITVILYLIGIFSDTNKEIGFYVFSWGYFALLFLFSIQAFFAYEYFELKTGKTSDSQDENKKLNSQLENDVMRDTPPVKRKSTFDYTINSLHKLNEALIATGNERFKTDINLCPSYYYLTPKRSRSNSILSQKSFIDYSFDLKILLKKTFELLIIVLVLTSALIKMNIVSFCLLACLVILFQRDLNATKMLYFSFLILLLLIIQYILFISNISQDTNPFYDTNFMNYLDEEYGIPWYKHVFGNKWGVFFSCGVMQYQLTSLWIDVILIIVLFFYLEFFSFKLYAANKDSSFIDKYHVKLLKLVEMKVMSMEKYRHFIKSMMMSYGITFKGNQIPNANNERDISINENDHDNRSLKSKSRKKEATQVEAAYKLLKQYFFLSFHYVSLLLILSLSTMNNGLISFGYLTFSIFYMYKSYAFLQGVKWTLGRGLKYFLKPYIFLDLLLQCIFQIPLDSFRLNSEFFIAFLDILGLQQLVNYNSNRSFLNTSVLLMDMLKVFILSLVLIQELIYASNDFKRFIIKYHIKYYQKAFVIGKLHAFLFNNHRISSMENSLGEREEIDGVLKQIQFQLNEWNSALMKAPKVKEKKKKQKQKTLRQLMNEIRKKRRREQREEKLNLKCEKLSFGLILKRHWLIALALYMNESSFVIETIASKDEKQIMRILKGELGIESELDAAIEKYNNYNGHEIDLAFLSKTVNCNKATKNNKSHIDKDKVENELLFIEKHNERDEEQYQKEKKREREREFNEIINDNSFFASSDYYDCKSEIRTDFLANYYSKSKIVIAIIKGLLLNVLYQFENVCYLLMIINHYQNQSLISVVYPLIVFSVGLILYPRPGKLYWKLSIAYCALVIFLKFFFQLDLWKTFAIFDYFSAQSNILGINRCPSKQCSDFLSYILLDFLLLVSLLINQFMLIRKGLWDCKEQDYETIEEAYQRIYKANANSQPSANNHHQSKGSIGHRRVELIGIINDSQMPPVKFSFKELFKQVFPSVRNEKPGKDFYTFYTIIQIMTLAYIIIFYTKMDRDKLIDSSESLIVKQFSGDSIIFALVQLCLIVLDRYIYLKNVRTLKKRGLKVYNVLTGIDVTNELNINDYEEAKKKCEESEQYDLVSFQYEGPKRALVIKYISQVITVIAIHFFVFWFLPRQGKKNTGEDDNTVMSNPYIFIFYFFYCFYFLFSALQLKCGMVDMRKLPTLMKGSSLVNSVIFKVYRAIPFLQELKGFIDWTFTITALDIFKWLKFEEILALVFINKCYQKSYFGSRVGSRVTPLMKRLIGVSSTAGLLLLLFGPLFLFSTINPSIVLNLVNGATLKVTLAITESNALNRNFTLINTKNALKIINMSNGDYQYLTQLYPSQLKNYEIDQIQNISMMGYSETNWDITSDALRYINNSIQDKAIETQHLAFEISFHYSFTNQFDPTQSSYIGYQSLNISNEILKPFFDGEFISCREDGAVNQILNNFEPNIRVSNQNNPKVLFSNQFPESITLSLHCYHHSLFWTITNERNDDQMTLTTYSDKYSPATAGYDVLTFYITFILVAGQFMRRMFVGEAGRIVITEMVDSRPLMNVCQGIRLSRLKKDFLKEDILYYVLIDLMRSPELLKTITKSSLQYIDPHNLIKAKDNQTTKAESVAIKNQFSASLRKAFS